MQAVADLDRNMVTVTLSERNLLALLAQLKDPDRPAPALFRNGAEGGPAILVQAQQDSEHYGEREPGAMRVKTEQGIVEIQGGES